MYEKSAFVFYITLILYLLTLFTVSYVGVYLTYIAIPVIAFSGLVMLVAKPKKQTQQKTTTVKHASRSTFEEAKKVFGTWEEAKEAFFGANHNKAKENEAGLNSEKSKDADKLLYEDIENERLLEELREKKSTR